MAKKELKKEDSKEEPMPKVDVKDLFSTKIMQDGKRFKVFPDGTEEEIK